MKNYKGKREEKYSFWKDVFCFSIMIWAIVLVYIFFMHLSEISLLEEQQEQKENQSNQTVQIISVDGSLSGDDKEAEGYASLEAMGLEVQDLYEHTANFVVTSYCGCSKCCGKYSGGSQSEAYGALGTKLTPYYSIAVDPNLIPLGTILWDEEGNYYKAEDTGSGIKGNHIDLFVGNHKEAWNKGTSYIQLYW